MNKLVIKIVKDRLMNDRILQQEIIDKISSRLLKKLEGGELKLDNTKKYLSNNDDNDEIFSLFVDEMIVSAPGHRLLARDLHQAFHLWYVGYLERTGAENMLLYRSDGGRCFIGRELRKKLDKKKIGLTYYLDIKIKNDAAS